MLSMLTSSHTLSNQNNDSITQNVRSFVWRLTDLQNSSERYGSTRKSPDYFTLQILFYFEAKNYAKVLELTKDIGNAIPVELKKIVAWSYIMQGNLFLSMAKDATEHDAKSLFNEAYENYEQASKIDPNQYEALSNWGCALIDHAKIETGNDAEDLLMHARQKFKAAFLLNPGKNRIVNNWGCALLEQARLKIGPEADLLFAEAIQKFNDALTINDKDSYARSNWGNALLWQAKQKATPEKSSLMKQAEEVLRVADMISPGVGAYDLACIAAQEEDEIVCMKWLERSKKYGTLPDPQYIATDEFFHKVRNCERFKEFLNQLNSSSKNPSIR